MENLLYIVFGAIGLLISLVLIKTKRIESKKAIDLADKIATFLLLLFIVVASIILIVKHNG